MRRARQSRIRGSILFQIGSLVLASIACVLAVHAILVALTPAPVMRPVSLADARNALLNEEAARRSGLLRTISVAAPLEESTGAGRLLAEALASGLQVRPKEVRVAIDQRAHPPARIVRPGAEQRIVLIGPRRSPAGRGEELSKLLLLPDLSHNGFKAAMRRADGSWVLVQPPSSPILLWRLRLLVAFLLSALLLAPIAWLAARRLTQPIRELADFAERADLERQVSMQPSGGSQEIEAAGTAIKHMHARLAAQAAAGRRALAAVAHDLRTPLTSLRLRAETAPPQERDQMAADIALMEGMVRQVIDFSAGQRNDEPHVPLELASIVSRCVADAQARGQKVVLAKLESIEVPGVPVDLQRAVSNLIENAIRYSGAAEVSAVAESRFASVVVEDCGPGLPENMLEKVQEPFFRGEQSRNLATGGVGLGLSIAKDIALQHGGDLVLSNRPSGGLRAELRIRR